MDLTTEQKREIRNILRYALIQGTLLGTGASYEDDFIDGCLLEIEYLMQPKRQTYKKLTCQKCGTAVYGGKVLDE